MGIVRGETTDNDVQNGDMMSYGIIPSGYTGIYTQYSTRESLRISAENIKKTGLSTYPRD